MLIRCQTDIEHEGLRLDLFLQQQAPEYSRGEIRKIIELGGVHLERRRVRKCGLLLSADQKLEIHVDGGPLDPYRITDEQIIYRDSYLIALNKPAGVETQPTPARYKGTLYEALQVLLGRNRRFGRKLEIGMVQRLDRDTSGIIVFSIHPRSHKSLTEQMVSRRVRKSYIALVKGCPEPPEGQFRSQLARARRGRKVKTVSAGGKEAITRYRVQEVFSGLSRVEVELVTGRMHQIRAHFAEAGHPLLGDLRYGGPDDWGGISWPRQCLHSWRLELSHPVTGEVLNLTAPVPDDMLIGKSG